ncbi:hypothetical protein V8G54_026187 [Vigna mungo]|uniref:Uncharacterized protein n=1 Tax=Vigna mungo TaxID=3915 RepID=A0AAQ3MZZ0_VIGMU
MGWRHGGSNGRGRLWGRRVVAWPEAGRDRLGLEREWGLEREKEEETKVVGGYGEAWLFWYWLWCGIMRVILRHGENQGRRKHSNISVVAWLWHELFILLYFEFGVSERAWIFGSPLLLCSFFEGFFSSQAQDSLSLAWIFSSRRSYSC